MVPTRIGNTTPSVPAPNFALMSSRSDQGSHSSCARATTASVTAMTSLSLSSKPHSLHIEDAHETISTMSSPIRTMGARIPLVVVPIVFPYPKCSSGLTLWGPILTQLATSGQRSRCGTFVEIGLPAAPSQGHSLAAQVAGSLGPGWRGRMRRTQCASGVSQPVHR